MWIIPKNKGNILYQQYRHLAAIKVKNNMNFAKVLQFWRELPDDGSRLNYIGNRGGENYQQKKKEYHVHRDQKASPEIIHQFFPEDNLRMEIMAEC